MVKHAGSTESSTNFRRNIKGFVIELNRITI